MENYQRPNGIDGYVLLHLCRIDTGQVLKYQILDCGIDDHGVKFRDLVLRLQEVHRSLGVDGGGAIYLDDNDVTVGVFVDGLPGLDHSLTLNIALSGTQQKESVASIGVCHQVDLIFG